MAYAPSTELATAPNLIFVSYPDAAWAGTAIRPGRELTLSLVTFGGEAAGPRSQYDKPPAWAYDALQRFSNLENLPYNWDSYGGWPLQSAHIRMAWTFLEKVMGDDLQRPEFIPLADGGLQLEWEAGDAVISFTTETDTPEPSLWLTTPSEDREVALDEATSLFDRFRTQLRLR